MYQAVSDIAVRLFVERGFDAVSVAEVAAAAEISKPTLFQEVGTGPAGGPAGGLPSVA
jgi:hypothetical protein